MVASLSEVRRGRSARNAVISLLYSRKIKNCRRIYGQRRIFAETLSRYDLNRSTIQRWVRIARQGISLNNKRQGRPPKDMARPKKREPQTELEKLQAENLRLRAENALLKKVKALVEEQEARARLNGQKPSTN